MSKYRSTTQERIIQVGNSRYVKGEFLGGVVFTDDPLRANLFNDYNAAYAFALYYNIKNPIISYPPTWKYPTYIAPWYVRLFQRKKGR